MPYTTLRVVADGPVTNITLAREQRLNAIDRAMATDLADAVTMVQRDSACRIVVFTGAGRAFSAGADIKERAEHSDDLSVQRTSVQVSSLFRRIELLDAVTIASVNGPAMGGGLELALACDLRIAGQDATFGLPEARLGILPGAGGTQRLPRLAGAGRAKELMLLARTLTADEALAWGLVTRVVPPADLGAEVRRLAGQILELAPLALRAIKQAVAASGETALDAGLQAEQRLSHELALTQDRREGYQAFVEKRTPRFIGK